MEFKEALKVLGIEKYEDRIMNSSSTGELFFLQDYIFLAELGQPKKAFSEWFESVVREAEQKWQRPESIFQHIPKILSMELEQLNNLKT